MSVKLKEKRFMTEQEKHLRKMMVDHQVSISEIAEHEGIDNLSTITHQLRSLTPSSFKRFKEIILTLSRVPQKAAS